MQLEVQMALNFVISYMYNKLPRRRVNIFGEELEKALRLKFQGHWYPNKPMKGSAYRCLKTGDPIDPVLEIAARQAGLELREIRENLPEDLAVWVDPGEVSYRIGEKGQIKILYSEASDIVCHEENLDKEVTKTFNPEAQCFNPIDNLSSAMSNISLSPKSSSPYSSNSPTPPFKPREASPVAAAFMQKSSAPLTFTIASFAQTKFGSTKLKSNSKRVNRMSPTEFSHYIKQRQMIQQQQLQNYSLQNPQQLLTQQSSTIGTSLPIGSTSNLGSAFAAVSSSRPQSLSPNQIDNVLFQNSNASTNQLYNPWGRGMLDPSVFSLQNAFNDVIPSNNQSGSKYHVFDQAGSGLMPTASNSSGAPASSAGHPADQLSNLNDGLTNIYPQSQYQHLLVAN